VKPRHGSTLLDRMAAMPAGIGIQMLPGGGAADRARADPSVYPEDFRPDVETAEFDGLLR